MAVFVVRHTRVAIAAGICYGSREVALAESFPDDAEMLLARLPRVARVISSPAERCRRLAALIAHRRNLTLSVDPRLREMDFGRWEGMAWDRIPRAELDAWADDLLHARPHGGETVDELRQRVAAALRDHDWQDHGLQDHDVADTGSEPLLVTHAGVIKAALHAARGDAAWSTAIDFGAHLRIC